MVKWNQPVLSLPSAKATNFRFSLYLFQRDIPSSEILNVFHQDETLKIRFIVLFDYLELLPLSLKFSSPLPRFYRFKHNGLTKSGL